MSFGEEEVEPSAIVIGGAWAASKTDPTQRKRRYPVLVRSKAANPPGRVR
jgi:hypothetical protein